MDQDEDYDIEPNEEDYGSSNRSPEGRKSTYS